MTGRTGRYPSATGRTGSYPVALNDRPDPERFARIVGGRIRDARVERGWSVFELARNADVLASNIRAYEVGLPVSLTALCKIAAALGVDARELMP